MFFDLSHEYFIFTDVIKHVDMEKTQTKRAGIFFQKILEDKRAIRACVQSNGNLTNWQKNVTSNSQLPYYIHQQDELVYHFASESGVEYRDFRNREVKSIFEEFAKSQSRK